jgi:hypothetical protein
MPQWQAIVVNQQPAPHAYDDDNYSLSITGFNPASVVVPPVAKAQK